MRAKPEMAYHVQASLNSDLLELSIETQSEWGFLSG